PREAALADLARRFFHSRGPATLRDFVWWTGLRVADARAGHAAIQAEMASEVIDGAEYWSFARTERGPRPGGPYLLPAFDEYLVGYQDRRDVLHADHVPLVNAGGGLLAPCVVVDGRVLGVWRRSLGKPGVTIELGLFGSVSRGTRTAIDEAAERYASFLAAPLAAVMTA
ncbi:MAG TPA: crosslink repair DNA glycosylase YcaQ family protein, partial [Kofleriaceae bacterium]|nr:crosslink repair DNA glycosylase YcaQ family protein [Kofleriaceae bacterium]